MQNELKSNEWARNCLHLTFKIEIQKGGANNSDFLQTWFAPEIRSPIFNLMKFHDSAKTTPESYRMRWNLMNDDEFGSIKLLKLKYRRVDQIIQTFFKIGSPQKLGPVSLICRNLKTLQKVLLNHADAFESNEWGRNCVHQTFKIEIQKGGPNNSDFLQNWYAQEIRSRIFNL